MNHRRWIGLAIALTFAAQLCAQTLSTQVQVVPPPLRQATAPSPTATVEELEKQGDVLRSQKAYLDALDYYSAALAKNPKSPTLSNKAGITYLMMQRLADAKKGFEAAVRYDKTYADAWNNLGVIYYMQKNYGRAIKNYRKAIELKQDMASYYSNLGSAYFSRKDLPKASDAYAKALEIDPEVFEHTSHAGVSAQMNSPEDRAHYFYLLAKMYARMGEADKSLEYLRKSMEEGYREINHVYKDGEFTHLRKDPRFTDLMANRPVAIPE